MTDRELLELAAKAAGIEKGESRIDCGISTTISDGRHGYLPRWNPLDDDGDALRLLVRLGMDVMFTPEDVEVQATQHGREVDGEHLNPWAWEGWTLKQQDPYAATRRAIVRAAAEIGRGMG